MNPPVIEHTLKKIKKIWTKKSGSGEVATFLKLTASPHIIIIVFYEGRKRNHTYTCIFSTRTVPIHVINKMNNF